MRKHVFLLITLLLMFGAARSGRAAEPSSPKTLYGITPFPFDYTLDAVARTQKICQHASTIWAIHLDNGIPWRESLAELPLPPKIQEEWTNQARAIPRGIPLYLGIAPLATDREHLAPAAGQAGAIAMPVELAGAALDSRPVVRAYTSYVLRACRIFKPRYLNVGIEAGELLSRNFAKWPQFVSLYRQVRAAVKHEFPTMQVGISFGLALLREPRAAAAARALVDESDYLGLSFYPYASAFDEKFGAPPLAAIKGLAEWRGPLDWVRRYTRKPIAICETGYTTRNIDLPSFGLHLTGTPALQAEYVHDLFTISRRDRYAFVVWYLAVDYDKLYARMPAGSEASLLWKNIGLFDGEAAPKPGWTAWKAELSARGR